MSTLPGECARIDASLAPQQKVADVVGPMMAAGADSRGELTLVRDGRIYHRRLLPAALPPAAVTPIATTVLTRSWAAPVAWAES